MSFFRLVLSAFALLVCVACSDSAPSGGNSTGPDAGDALQDTSPGDVAIMDVVEPQTDSAQTEEDMQDVFTSDAPVLDAEIEDSGAEDLGNAEDAGSPLLFNEAIFKATHNSYSGEGRRSLQEQLEAGVRFLELDIHDNDFQTHGDWRIGHDAPGDEVSRDGSNPPGDNLRDWLELIATWSQANPNHLPITLGLDIKDDLTDNRAYNEGSLAALNDRLEEVLGGRLLLASTIELPWPELEALRGRILVVLSGHEPSRLAYRRDRGANPSVAMNSLGHVVEVHDSGAGHLWYWTGQYQASGEVVWHRHGRYDTGQTPAVAINDAGWIVEVHQSQILGRIWYHVGRLDPESFEITWYPSHEYGSGVLPTVQFVELDGDEVHAIHRSENTGNNWEWSGQLNTREQTVAWTGNATIDAPRYPSATATVGAMTLSVMTGPDDAAPGDTLRYTTTTTESARIRYRQVAFIEVQPGNDDALFGDRLYFYAAHAFNTGFAEQWRREGKLVRQWNFNDDQFASDPPANFAATDHPFEAWYLDYCALAGCRP